MQIRLGQREHGVLRVANVHWSVKCDANVYQLAGIVWMHGVCPWADHVNYRGLAYSSGNTRYFRKSLQFSLRSIIRQYNLQYNVCVLYTNKSSLVLASNKLAFSIIQNNCTHCKLHHFETICLGKVVVRLLKMYLH